MSIVVSMRNQSALQGEVKVGRGPRGRRGDVKGMEKAAHRVDEPCSRLHRCTGESSREACESRGRIFLEIYRKYLGIFFIEKLKDSIIAFIHGWLVFGL